MAAIRINLRSLLGKVKSGVMYKIPQYRQSSFYNSPFLVDIGEPNVKYEVTRSPEEWMYVEQTLPPVIVPTPVPKAKYPSEWKPQSENVQNKPYYIPRTKNHMIPVYLKISQFGIRRVTFVRKIQGDIWLLEKQLRDFLEPQLVRPLRSQVNEFAGFIRFYGDHVNAIKYWLMKQGL